MDASMVRACGLASNVRVERRGDVVKAKLPRSPAAAAAPVRPATNRQCAHRTTANALLHAHTR
jgi:hypothetical protein